MKTILFYKDFIIHLIITTTKQTKNNKNRERRRRYRKYNHFNTLIIKLIECNNYIIIMLKEILIKEYIYTEFIFFIKSNA